MMIVQATDLPFVSISRSTCMDSWKLHELKVLIILAYLTFLGGIVQFTSQEQCRFYYFSSNCTSLKFRLFILCLSFSPRNLCFYHNILCILSFSFFFFGHWDSFSSPLNAIFFKFILPSFKSFIKRLSNYIPPFKKMFPVCLAKWYFALALPEPGTTRQGGALARVYLLGSSRSSQLFSFYFEYSISVINFSLNFLLLKFIPNIPFWCNTFLKFLHTGMHYSPATGEWEGSEYSSFCSCSPGG